MNLQSLLLSSEDKTVRIFRRVLGGLDIGVQQYSDTDSAVYSLTRQRFEAIILDCGKEGAAARMLASVRSAPGNQHAIVAAVVDHIDPRNGLAMEADLVLQKPVSFDQAYRRFRAARYLMKCECRRNRRVAVEFPVSLLGANARTQRAVTSDISEGGMAVRLPRLCKKSSPVQLRFTLPGTDTVLDCTAELAWENAQSEAGFRFVGLSPEQRERLRVWLSPYFFDYQVPDGAAMPEVMPGFAPATE